MQGNHKAAQPFGAWVRQCIKTHKMLTGVVFAVLLILVIWLLLMPGGKTSRTESYKKVTGVAGLDATINYDCHKDCKQKYNFNVYIFNEDGQQANVIRPDKNGKVQLAMNEGKYVLLIGKQFGKDKLFPQEKVTLKNGQALELKLEYK